MVLRWKVNGRCITAVFALFIRQSLADIDNIFPIIWSTNPVAQHVACAVPAGAPTVCQLFGFETNNKTLQFLVNSLPSAGALYETSQNFRTYGTDPKYAPTPILASQLPFVVSDSLSRIVFVPPSDVFPPEGRWAAFTYIVQEPVSGAQSQPGQVSFSNPAQYIASSSFISGIDGWTISGNINSNTPVWEAYGWGLLNRYIYGTDEVQYLDFETNSDRSKWYFVAPPGKYYLPEMASAYGGTLQFTISSTYGDFKYLNSPLDFVTLECASCNSGRGLRIIRMADNGLEWDGSERVIQIPLKVGAFWLRDQKNAALPMAVATDCEISAVLAGLTRLAILGDFTRAGEGVAIDDVAVISATTQPAMPLKCQQGCTCAHYPAAQRQSCCGSNPNIYYPT